MADVIRKKVELSGTAGHPDGKPVSRRRALGLLGVAGAALGTTACSGDTPTSASSTTTTTPGAGGTNAVCAVSPSETLGPFPNLGDFVRSDVREDRQGLPLQLTINVVNVNQACAAVSGAAVEIWQCDVAGDYSQYGNVRSATFLRGLQTTDGSGRATFTTIYPGWYQGRATHIHVDVSVNGRSVKVTQIAFPEDITASVYRTGVYASRGQNTTSNARDGIFSDSLAQQLISITGGDTANGYTGTFQVGVSI
jgi:protocatechuate 3,4-dioxygenase beta subunit